MGDRERGDRLDERPESAQEQKQPENEEQVIDPKQDVMSAQHEVSACEPARGAGPGAQVRQPYRDASAVAAEQCRRPGPVPPADQRDHPRQRPGQRDHVIEGERPVALESEAGDQPHAGGFRRQRRAAGRQHSLPPHNRWHLRVHDGQHV
jgi:hypothetical protein